MPMMIFTSSLNCDSAFLCPGYMCHSPGPSTLADVPPTLHLTFPLGLLPGWPYFYLSSHYGKNGSEND